MLFSTMHVVLRAEYYPPQMDTEPPYRPQTVQIGRNSTSTSVLNTGAPQGFVLSCSHSTPLIVIPDMRRTLQ